MRRLYVCNVATGAGGYDDEPVLVPPTFNSALETVPQHILDRFPEDEEPVEPFAQVMPTPLVGGLPLLPLTMGAKLAPLAPLPFLTPLPTSAPSAHLDDEPCLIPPTFDTPRRW